MTKEENEKRLANLKNIVLNLPDKPGSYQFYDKDKPKSPWNISAYTPWLLS
ncbi:MAG: hypothetical protein II100_04665 [Prevotella sp.]|nr:hypothetical protein [Prevotella sp.]